MRGADAPRRPWSGKRVLLGVTGGIAAYKAVQVARDLTRRGAEVDVVLSSGAREFVGALTFEGVTGRPVAGELLATGNALQHIRLARECDVVCIAPATADFLARAAHGRSDEMLGAILLATRAPVLVFPAMNDRMWSHPQTAGNARHLAETLQYTVVGPAEGPLAYGEGEGPGRLEEPEVILEHIGRALEVAGPLAGRRVVVTAGPTREAVDAVRFLSNRSSGRMGYALAAAAWRRHARVTLISGPSHLPPPTGPDLLEVVSAQEMCSAVAEELRDADVLVMSAAVADFSLVRPAAAKIKKASAPPVLELEASVDILEFTRELRRGRITVGFALETDSPRENARAKLREKQLDLVVLNDATRPGAGFDVPTNEVVLLGRDGSEEELPLLLKEEVAEAILDRVEALLEQRG